MARVVGTVMTGDADCDRDCKRAMDDAVDEVASSSFVLLAARKSPPLPIFIACMSMLPSPPFLLPFGVVGQEAPADVRPELGRNPREEPDQWRLNRLCGPWGRVVEGADIVYMRVRP